MNRFNRLISLQDASEKYRKHESTLRTLINRGKFVEGIDCMKYGKTWVFNEDALDKFYGINKEGGFAMEINKYIENHKDFFSSDSKIGLFKLGTLIQHVKNNITEKQFEPYLNILMDGMKNECNWNQEYILKHIYTKLMKLVVQYDLGCENVLEDISVIIMDNQFKLEDSNYFLYICLGMNIYNEVN